jgi:hypothetical protein
MFYTDSKNASHDSESWLRYTKLVSDMALQTLPHKLVTTKQVVGTFMF